MRSAWGLAGGSVGDVEGGEFFGPGKRGRLEEADAAVPTEDGVVVAMGADFFCFAEADEGAFEERKHGVGRLAGVELGFGAAFAEEAGIVKAFVGIGEALENFFGFAKAIHGDAEKLVGDGEAEKAQGELVIGVDGENVATDGFGFLGLVEIAVKLGLGGGFGDAGLCDVLEVVVHFKTLFSTIRGKWKVGYIEEQLEKKLATEAQRKAKEDERQRCQAEAPGATFNSETNYED
jgi:hypothetical protein